MRGYGGGVTKTGLRRIAHSLLTWRCSGSEVMTNISVKAYRCLVCILGRLAPCMLAGHRR